MSDSNLISDAERYLYQGVWGVTRRDFLLSFLLRALLRDQPCKVPLAVRVTGDQELCWHCEGQGGSTGCMGHRTSPNSTRGYCKAAAINRVQSCSAESCWSKQHPSRTLLSEVPHSSWHNRDNATGKCTAVSKKDTEKEDNWKPQCKVGS